MEVTHFLAINLSYLIYLRFKWYVAWYFHSDDRLLRAVTTLGQCPTPPYTCSPFLWVTNSCTNSCWSTYPKCILAVFDLPLLSLSSTEKIPVILHEREITCWPPPWTSLGWSLSSVEPDEGVLWSSSAQRPVASPFSFGLPVCKGSQHSFFHKTQSKNWTGKKGALWKGKDIHGLSDPWVSVALFFSSVLFYFLSQSRELLLVYC